MWLQFLRGSTQKYPITSLLESDGKDVTPTPVPPSSDTENQSLPLFLPFPLLPQDFKIFILTFVAKAAMEDPIVQTSPLTHALPLVSRQFRDMSRSNCLWQSALEQLVQAEPSLWKEGLLKLHACDTSSSSELVRVVHKGLGEPGYFRLYRMVVARFVRFTSPVFCMTGNVRLGQRIGLHLFEPRYQVMIQLVMEGYPQEARDGRQIVSEDLPYFVYAHAAPFSASSPACLVNVQRCVMHEDGTADVLLMPVAHIKMERLWVQPNTGRLHFAQCFRLGASHRVEPRSLVVGNDARARRLFDSCPPCCIQ
jgi:hypothetical protein